MDRIAPRRAGGNLRLLPTLMSGALLLALICSGRDASGEARDAGAAGALGPSAAGKRVCSGECDLGTTLSEAQVMTIIDQGARELRARGVPGVIAVVDRVGNPLAVWATSGEPLELRVSTNRPRDTAVADNSFANGLESSVLPASFGALSKAITGAYLSSQGNAFSTRTANFIVQSNFPPSSSGEASGPLFGVQFSQLSCGDWARRDDPQLQDGRDAFDGFLDGRAGPKRSPLGLAADPGGFPLYIDGVLVGGVGAAAQETTGPDAMGRSVPFSVYGVDGSPLGAEPKPDLEEEIALAALRGFEASEDRLADRVVIMGRTLRYSSDGRGRPRTPPDKTAVDRLPDGGGLIAVPGFYDGASVRAGTAFGTPESGVAPATGSPGVSGGFGTDRRGRPVQAQLLVNPDGTPFLGRLEGTPSNPRASLSPPAPVGLTPDEVTLLLGRALAVAQEGRSQIRRPEGSPIQVNVHICDRDGNSLGYARSPDAPLFGSDVALQKCRTAALLSRGAPTDPPGLSSPSSAELLLAEDKAYQDGGRSKVAALLGAAQGVRNLGMAQYLARLRDAFGKPGLLTDGIAFSNRAVGSLARPCVPDGLNCASDGRGGLSSSAATGPLSVDAQRKFSPFSNGFQIEYAKDALLDATLGRTLGVPEPTRCGTLAANGFQIFPGSVAVFKRSGGESGEPESVYLVGAIGVSGDGVDQDDLVAFLGVERAAKTAGSQLQNAPARMRANQLSPRSGGGTFLRYVNCPPSPFNAPFEKEQNVCGGG